MTLAGGQQRDTHVDVLSTVDGLLDSLVRNPTFVVRERVLACPYRKGRHRLGSEVLHILSFSRDRGPSWQLDFRRAAVAERLRALRPDSSDAIYWLGDLWWLASRCACMSAGARSS
jgi:hypothetical protein